LEVKVAQYTCMVKMFSRRIRSEEVDRFRRKQDLTSKKSFRKKT
jgi:hypothetical protein